MAALALAVMLVFLGRTGADADLWGHLSFGRDIVRAGAVHATDPYSFTSDRRWINHEWLAESVMWTAWNAGGAPGLVTLKLLLACLAGSLLLVRWQGLHLRPAPRLGLLFATALGVWPLLATMRPQAFSVALFAALLFVLERTREGSRRAPMVLPPLFAVWVNVHGGWIVGAGVLAIVVGCSLLDAAWPERARWRLIGAAALSAAATLCNPYGFEMLGFLADTVRPARTDIVEWRPVTQLPIVAFALWSLPAALAGWSIWCAAHHRSRREGRGAPFGVPASGWLVTLLLAAGAFRVVRLGGFFALAVAFLLVPHARRLPSSRAVPAPAWRALGRQLAAGAVLVPVAVLLAGRELPVSGTWAPEPEAAAVAKARGLTGRMLTWFDYGQYAIWHLGPGVQVSMDGRRETVYSPETRDLHARIYAGGPAALSAVATMAPDHVWVPRNMPLAATLAASGWPLVFQGPRSVIFSRKAPQSEPVVIARSTAQVFPGN